MTNGNAERGWKDDKDTEETLSELCKADCNWNAAALRIALYRGHRMAYI